MPGLRGRPRARRARRTRAAQPRPVPERRDRAGLSRDHLRDALARAACCASPTSGPREPTATWRRADTSAQLGRAACPGPIGDVFAAVERGQRRTRRRAGREHHRGRRHADARRLRRVRSDDLRRSRCCASRITCSRAAGGSKTCAGLPRSARCSPSAGVWLERNLPGVERVETGEHRRRGASGGRGRERRGDRQRARGEVYGLRTIEAAIEDRRDNTTRFLADRPRGARAQRPGPDLRGLHDAQGAGGRAAPPARAVRAARREPHLDPVAADPGQALGVPVLPRHGGTPRRPAGRARARRSGARGLLAPRAGLVPARRRAAEAPAP